MQPQIYVSLLSYLTVPVFVVLAYRAWAILPRQALSNWRNKLGLTSMLVVSADWCFVIIFIFAAKSRIRWMRSVADDWFSYMPLVALFAIFLVFTLKGKARVCS